MGFTANVGAPGTVNAASGGKIYAYNTISDAANTTVAPANPSRVRIRFHNPGANDVYIAPLEAYTSATAVTPATLIASPASPGGSFILFAQGTLEFTGECQGAWRAFAAAGAGSANALTVMDSNVV